VKIEKMSQSTVKKLLIYTALLFLLNGCAGSSGSDSSSGSAVSVVQSGDRSALISWNSPTRNTDDSVLTDLTGFKIYYGMFVGDYDNTITINNAGLSSYLVENLAAADWCFVMVAFNSSGTESTYSAGVCKTID
jgi:hypothetical protein